MVLCNLCHPAAEAAEAFPCSPPSFSPTNSAEDRDRKTRTRHQSGPLCAKLVSLL